MHPILFNFGPITIYSYGTLVAFGFLLATYLLLRELKKNAIMSPGQLTDLALCALIFGVIGARLLHVALNIDIYLSAPRQVFFLTRGGLAFQGGVVLAVLVCSFFLTRKKVSIWKAGDLIMPFVALGQSIGRIGCFFNGCCFGKPDTSFLSLIFPHDGMARYPTQIYLVVGLLAIFVILRLLYRRKSFEIF